MSASIILTSPEMRAVVQDHSLEKGFFTGARPKNLYRAKATSVAFAMGGGDGRTYTADGMMPVNAAPISPGDDAEVKDYAREQWAMLLRTYGQSKDTHTLSSAAAAVPLIVRDQIAVGANAGQSLNRVARNVLFRAALSGWTVCDGVQTGVTALRVMRLNGFTRVRNPNTAGASIVGYEPVSAANPLAIEVYYTGAYHTRSVTGFTPDTAGDEFGPGTLTVLSTTVADRAIVRSTDRTSITRIGGVDSVDGLTAGTKATLSSVRSAVQTLEGADMPVFPDGTYHMDLDVTMKGQLWADSEFQGLFHNNDLRPGSNYDTFQIGRLLGTTVTINNESPQISTVGTGTGLSADYNAKDPFPGELYNTGIASGTKIHRALLMADQGFFEYYADDPFLTESGYTGVVRSASQMLPDGAQYAVDRVNVFLRSANKRIADMVSSTWRAIMDWTVRTDSTAVNGLGRYRRVTCIEAGE